MASDARGVVADTAFASASAVVAAAARDVVVAVVDAGSVLVAAVDTVSPGQPTGTASETARDEPRPRQAERRHKP